MKTMLWSGLQVLQRGDDGVVVQDATLDLVEGLQQGLLQLAQAQLELTWGNKRELINLQFIMFNIQYNS